MTICTCDKCVFSQQRECRLTVIEAGHAVVTVVTIQAVLSEVLDMLESKGLIVNGMALGAFIRGYRKSTNKTVAGCAGYSCPVVVELMPLQAEIGNGMVEFLHGWQG